MALSRVSPPSPEPVQSRGLGPRPARLLAAGLVLLLLLAGGAARADTPALNRTYSLTSSDGSVVLTMTPAQEIGGVGQGFGLARDKATGRELWRVEWYASPGHLFLLGHGSRLVRLGPWARDHERLSDLAWALYERGGLKASYRVADLVRDRSRIVRTASHYFWLDEKYPLAISLDETRFSLFTIDGRAVHLDTHGGGTVSLEGQDRIVAKARRVWEQGERLLSRGRRSEAARKFKKSLELWPNPLMAAKRGELLGKSD